MEKYGLIFFSVLLYASTNANNEDEHGNSSKQPQYINYDNNTEEDSNKLGYKTILLIEPKENSSIIINKSATYNTQDPKYKHRRRSHYDNNKKAQIRSNTHRAHSEKFHRKDEKSTKNKSGTKTSHSTNGAINNYIDEIDDRSWVVQNKAEVDTRRILYSKPAKHPHMAYMVYLQLAKNSVKANKYKGWLCGGVIVHRYYVLTSAACVEDADHFFVVSGTSNWIEADNVKQDKCVCKNRRKVIWKCTPKTYRFDFRDSEKWAANDIAIVRVDKAFNLNIRERHCEYATEAVAYNNISRQLEVAGNKGFILGWGSQGNFREGVYRRKSEVTYFPKNAYKLQQAKVMIMDNDACAKKWAPKFRPIIKQYMICTKDILKRLSAICDKQHAKCREIEDDYRKYGKFNETLLEESGIALKETMVVDSNIVKDVPLKDEPEDKPVKLDLGRHLLDPDDFSARRSTWTGGFCENDHGGPLVVNNDGQTVVVGVISACKIDPKKHMCHGPFLYTSVFNNRQFISCSIFKDVEETCRRVFRTGVTHDEWAVDWDGVDDEEDKERIDRAGETRELDDEEANEPPSETMKPEHQETDAVTKVTPMKTNKVTTKPTSTTKAKHKPKTTKPTSIGTESTPTKAKHKPKTTEPSTESDTKKATPLFLKLNTDEPVDDMTHIHSVFKSYESSSKEGA